jgi:hypothetical protein
MSILDPIDVQFERGDRMIEDRQRIEEELSFLLAPGFVECLSSSLNSNKFLEKIAEVYGLPKTERTLGQALQIVLDKSLFDLKKHKNRRVISLDLRDLKKGDAYGFMKTLSRQIDDQILVLENVTQISEGDPAIYDDKLYVENLLIRSWKNKRITAGELDFK